MHKSVLVATFFLGHGYNTTEPTRQRGSMGPRPVPPKPKKRGPPALSRYSASVTERLCQSEKGNERHESRTLNMHNSSEFALGISAQISSNGYARTAHTVGTHLHLHHAGLDCSSVQLRVATIGAPRCSSSSRPEFDRGSVSQQLLSKSTRERHRFHLVLRSQAYYRALSPHILAQQ